MLHPSSMYCAGSTMLLAPHTLLEGVPSACQVNRHYGQATGLARQLGDKLAELQRVSQQMDGVWRMHALRESAVKKDIWKRKVEQVAEESDDLRAALDKHMHRERRLLAL